MMTNEKRLIDAIKHRLEGHIAKAIYFGVDNIPTGKDSSSATEFLRGYERGALETANIALGMIPVDAVEVVRCKDCKKCGVLEHIGKLYCKKPMGCLGCVQTEPNNFCSYGERKDNA